MVAVAAVQREEVYARAARLVLDEHEEDVSDAAGVEDRTDDVDVTRRARPLVEQASPQPVDVARTVLEGATRRKVGQQV